MPRPRLRQHAIGLLFLAALAGCGSKLSTVSGKITYRDKPVTRGQISFIAADGQSASTTLDADGGYTVAQVPRGELTVIISSFEAEGAEKLGIKILPKAPKLRSLVPERYNEAETSPLKVMVKSSHHRYDFDLKDE
jgi:hypothetical protein